MVSPKLAKTAFELTLIGMMLFASAFGQSATGIITGRVSDVKNNRIPNAEVTAVNPKTGYKRKAKTDDKGYFNLIQLKHGRYTLTVEKAGYKPFTKEIILEPMGRANANPINITPSDLGGSQEESLEIVLVAWGELANGKLHTGPSAWDGDSNLIARRNRPIAELLRIDSASNEQETSTISFGAVTEQSGNGGTTQGATQTKDPAPLDAGRLQVQSLSGERSDLVTNNQVRNLALNGRDILEFLKLVPGIVSEFNGQISNPGGLDRFYINGTRGNQHELAIDGISNIDTASNGARHVTINPDAVAEIKVLTANYQAEYGKAAGGFIQIVTKFGTTDFHGGARYFVRNEALNANNFFNNAEGRNAEGKEILPRQIYRYNTFGYDLGGPFYLPRFGEGGPSAKKIDNLFFFVSQEFYRQVVPNPERSIRVPTEEERNGDFRNSVNNTGRGPIFLRDPTRRDMNGNPLPCAGNDTRGCFVYNGQLNVIPPDRFFLGGRILSYYPMPNIVPTAANFFRNYVSQTSTKYPRMETVARIDSRLSEQTDFSGRVIHNLDEQALPYGFPGTINLTNTARLNQTLNPNSQNFDGWNLISPRPGLNLAFTITHAFGQTVTGEFIFGLSRNQFRLAPEAGQARLTADFPQLFPKANPERVIPNFDFGDLIVGPGSIWTTRAPETTYIGLPFKSFNRTHNFAANLTKVWNAHLVKVGLFIQQNRREQTAPVQNTGFITFALAGIDPLVTTGHAFANALIGNYNRYQQASSLPTGVFRYRNVEGYIQDLWRVNDRLVLDLGLRLSWYQPQYDEQLQTAFFNPDLFDRNKAVRLYVPTQR